MSSERSLLRDEAIVGITDKKKSPPTALAAIDEAILRIEAKRAERNKRYVLPMSPDSMAKMAEQCGFDQTLSMLIDLREELSSD